MLRNTLTVAEWANLWEGENNQMCIAVQNKWLENYFSDEQKTKIYWSHCTFPYTIKAAKIARVIIILRMFVLENLISVISVLLDIHSIFICSITGFRAIDYPSPESPPCANTPLSYTCIVGTRVGWRGGGMICYKTFPNFYMFHCKKHSFYPKLSPCSIPNGKLIPLS